MKSRRSKSAGLISGWNPGARPEKLGAKYASGGGPSATINALVTMSVASTLAYLKRVRQKQRQTHANSRSRKGMQPTFASLREIRECVQVRRRKSACFRLSIFLSPTSTVHCRGLRVRDDQDIRNNRLPRTHMESDIRPVT